MKERLLTYLEYLGMGQNAFESICGLATGTISKLTFGIRSDKLAQIAKKFPNLNIRWLITGEGDMVKENPSVRGIPVLPYSAVGGYLAENNTEETDLETCYVPEFTARGADFLIRVDGDSMYPRYHNGELLAIKIVRDPSFFQWGKVYVLSTKQGCIVKRVMPAKDDDSVVVCHSENSSLYPDYRISKKDILNVAVVVGHIGAE